MKYKKNILIICLALCFFSIFGNSKNGIYVRSIKLTLIDAETKLPVPGLKIKNIITISKPKYVYLFGIGWLCIGGHLETFKDYIDEFETDENGNVVIPEKLISVDNSWQLNSQRIKINIESIENDKFSITHNQEYKKILIEYTFFQGLEAKYNSDESFQKYNFYIDLPDRNFLGYFNKHKSFGKEPDSIQIEIEHRVSKE